MRRARYVFVCSLVILAGVWLSQAEAAVIPISTQNYSFTTIDIPGASGTAAVGINDAAQIVGQFIGATGKLGFLDTQGSFTSIGFPGAHTTAALGINSGGLIVGTYRDASSIDHGFLFSAATSTFIPINVPGSTNTAGQGINGEDQIVGYFSDASGTHGFLDTGGSFTSIDVPGASFQGQATTEAFGINDLGQIIGGFFDPQGDTHGFLDTQGSFTSIDIAGASATAAYGINDAGHVVGGFVNSTGEHGFLETGAGIISLDFPGASGTEADGINDAGQIVGAYFDSSGEVHGFLATPVPEPATLVMLGTSIFLFGGILRRKELLSRKTNAEPNAPAFLLLDSNQRRTRL